MFCPEGGKGDAGAASVAQWVGEHAEAFSEIQSVYTGVGTGTWLAGLACGLSQLELPQLERSKPIAVVGVPAVAGKKWLSGDIESYAKRYILLIRY